MDARTAKLAAWRPRIDTPIVVRLVQAAAICAFLLLAVAGLLILVRRASGALVAPLPAGLLVGWAGLLAVLAVAFRRFIPLAVPIHSRSWLYVIWTAPSAVLLLWSIGLSVAGSGGGLWCLWGLLLLEEGWSWKELPRMPPTRTESRVAPLNAACPPAEAASGLGTLDHSNDEIDESVSQQIVRSRHDDGCEAITGWVRADFAPSSRHATAHVAICPPFSRTPECFAEQMDGPSAQIKVAQVLSHGVRFEIKLDQPADLGARVLVEFSIQERRAD
jgi:hypothetical protein